MVLACTNLVVIEVVMIGLTWLGLPCLSTKAACTGFLSVVNYLVSKKSIYV